jgi:hypothetical protein
MPRVSTRVLDPLADRPLIDRLSVGGAGPVRLFKDPCWFELSGARCVARDADPGDTIGS